MHLFVYDFTMNVNLRYFQFNPVKCCNWASQQNKVIVEKLYDKDFFFFSFETFNLMLLKNFIFIIPNTQWVCIIIR